MTLWLTNPARGRKRKRRKLAGAALAAHLKKIGRKAKRRTGTARRAAKRAVQSGGSMAKRRKRRRANPKRRRRAGYIVGKARIRRRKMNPVGRRRRRRHYRRNPGAVRGLMQIATQGVKDAAGVVIGKAATRTVSGLIPFGANTGIVGALKQVVVAVGVGYGAHRFMGKDFARMVVAGGIAAPLETFVKSLNIPLLSPALAAGDEAYAALGAYPLAAYPRALAGVADVGDGMGAEYAWSEM